MTAPKRWLWITDPWETLDHPRDTTLRLVQEALLIGKAPRKAVRPTIRPIEQYWCDVRSIRVVPHSRGQAFGLDAQKFVDIGASRKPQEIRLGPTKTWTASDFTQIHYRTDPPVDSKYLHPLQILKLALSTAQKTEVVNPIDILLGANEKMEGMVLSQKGTFPPSPPGVVSSQWEILKKFGESEKRTVLKPLHEAQSHGVELLDWRTKEGVQYCKKLLLEATHGFAAPVLIQKYLGGISDGETRIWFIDGRFLAAVKKLPVAGDFRVNIDKGSQVIRTELTSLEKKTAQTVGRHLKTKKIRLAAVDLIEGCVTDFNFTSPGLIPKMEEVLEENLARKIVETLAKH